MNYVGQSALMRSISRPQTVRLLLSLNVDTTKTDRSGKTAFQLADNVEVKQLLMEHEKKSVRWRYILKKENQSIEIRMKKRNKQQKIQWLEFDMKLEFD